MGHVSGDFQYGVTDPAANTVLEYTLAESSNPVAWMATHTSFDTHIDIHGICIRTQGGGKKLRETFSLYSFFFRIIIIISLCSARACERFFYRRVEYWQRH